MQLTWTRPVPVIGWASTREEWLAARKQGIGASDVGALLGFSPYTTPWQVWADKTGHPRPVDILGPAVELGNELEPWLLDQACRLLDETVVRTGSRMYAHPEYPHHLASPDGHVGSIGDRVLVECKTAGLMGWGTPEGWSAEDIPLGYELQGRWQMHVMNYQRVTFVSLVAGMGLVLHHLDRDTNLEAELVRQVDEWWNRHVVAGEEPSLGAGDAEVLAQLFPRSNNEATNLDGTDALRLCATYRDHLEAEKNAKAAKEAVGAQLKALLGEHDRGQVENRTVVAWSNRAGNVDYLRALTELAEDHGIELPDLDLYRRPGSRSLSVKDLI